MKKELENNIDKDSRTEMNKIFLVYSCLDMKSQAQQVYLDHMLKV